MCLVWNKITEESEPELATLGQKALPSGPPAGCEGLLGSMESPAAEIRSEGSEQEAETEQNDKIIMLIPNLGLETGADGPKS